MSKKLRVAVVFGGVSSEYEVSLQSAASVIRNLPRDKFEVVCIGITKSGRWLFYPGNPDEIVDGTWHNNSDCCSAVISPDRTHNGILKVMDDNATSLLKIDCVFPVLHGKNGEDGTIQGLLQLSGIPFVGCDTLSSAVCMDKDITHSVLELNGIKNAKWDRVTKSQLPELDEICKNLINKLGLPMFVKPANAGSSVGISKATDYDSLRDSIKLAFTHDSKVVVEETINGREIECAVLGNDEPKAAVLGEIISCNEFYDYEAKYIASSTLKIPADLDNETADRIKETAIAGYKALGCGGMARVDFFVTENNEIYLNETNTIPGFTAISMYSKMWGAAGLPYGDLLEKLVMLAIDKQQNTITN